MVIINLIYKCQMCIDSIVLSPNDISEKSTRLDVADSQLKSQYNIE